MSKASEWLAKRPDDLRFGDQWSFAVDDYSGGLILNEDKGGTLSSASALDLASWILDVFGDSAPEGGKS